MLEKPISHLLQRDSNVLLAYLFANDQEGHGGQPRMEPSEHAGQNRCVSHSRVKESQGWCRGRDVPGGQCNPFGDLGLLVGGVDELEVLLSVVEETERLYWRSRSRLAKGFLEQGADVRGCFGF